MTEYVPSDATVEAVLVHLTHGTPFGDISEILKAAHNTGWRDPEEVAALREEARRYLGDVEWQGRRAEDAEAKLDAYRALRAVAQDALDWSLTPDALQAALARVREVDPR